MTSLHAESDHSRSVAYLFETWMKKWQDYSGDPDLNAFTVIGNNGIAADGHLVIGDQFFQGAATDIVSHSLRAAVTDGEDGDPDVHGRDREQQV